MDSSKLLIAPAHNGPSTSKASVEDTANSFGVHDTFRHGLRSLAVDIKGGNALQQRLEKWEETQDNLKLNLHRNLYGLHAPVRQLMERRLVANTHHIPAFPHSNIHLDILMGRDETLDVSDFFGDEAAGPDTDIRTPMEKRLRL